MDHNKILSDIAALVGAEKIVTDEKLLATSNGYPHREYEKAFEVYMAISPLCIVFAESVEDIVKVVTYCNENKVILIPRAGGSAGEGLLEAKEEGVVMLDCSKMNKLIKFDEYNMMATVQCGYSLEQLEKIANEKGLTTGHAPQSISLACLGGLVATRSIGQFSTYYGGIEDMVCGLEAVMPDGRIVRIRNVPRRSSGPDLRHLFIGSEGALGYITEVTVKLFPYYPDDMWMGGYIVSDIDTGFQAIHDIMVAGYKPAVIRLYDKSDMDHNFGSVKLKNQEAFMFFTAEGPASIAKATGEGIDAIAKKYNAEYIGTEAVAHWFEHRNDLTKKIGSEANIKRHRETNVYYATLEISASWSDIIDIYHDVMNNVPEKVPNLVMLGGHVSHSYINGTNIYFVYRQKMSSPEASHDEQMVFIKALCEEVLKRPTGGVVHHHGMGKERVIFADREHGSSYSLIKDLKATFDPNGIMNKGTLIQAYDE